MNTIINKISSVIGNTPSGQYDCADGNTLFLFNAVSKADCIEVDELLVNNKFSLKQKNSVDNFHSLTFDSPDKSFKLIVMFDEAVGELRIVQDDFSADLNTVPYKAGETDVKLWQYEIDHSLIDCGMCYIFQCSDYSFFIIDSAHTYSVNDDIRIFEFLRERTPEHLQVTVSAWFLSHGHVDHIGKFLDILKYNKDIFIKGIYYNFVSNKHISSHNWMQSDINHTELFNDFIAKNESIPVYKLHSGQYFCVDSLRVDVLCSHEDVYPGDLENYNDSSVVIMVSCGEDKICFPGDAGGAESLILERRFPDFLKCDIMQVAHHGHFGTSSQFYRLSDASVSLFATTYIKFEEELPHYEANRVACDLAEHTFIASDGTVEFTFPLKDSVIKVYPDEIFENFEGIYNLWAYTYSDEYKSRLLDRHKSFADFRYFNFVKK